MLVADLALHSAVRDYIVDFSHDADFITPYAEEAGATFVVDENVWLHHADGLLAGLPPELITSLPIAEERKNLEQVQWLYDRLLERGMHRSSTFVSIGGGITQDITGYVASTLYRGLRWVFVPTTLLAQADSCIGSKTSLNYRHFKNLLGTFYPPSAAHVRTAFLATLSQEDFFSGLGEVVKLHLMGGRAAVDSLSELMPRLRERDAAASMEAVVASLAIKKTYIEGDEFDLGRRNLLNFGHCFGHAIETATDFAVPHGQAVVMGMLLAGIVASERGVLDEDSAASLNKEILMPALISVLPHSIDEDTIVEAMRHDKKRVGDGLAVVMVGNGLQMSKAVDVSEDEARRAWRRFVADYTGGS